MLFYAVLFLVLIFTSGKLVHAAEHVAEVAGEFLALLEDMDGEEEGIEVRRAIMHRVEGTLVIG